MFSILVAAAIFIAAVIAAGAGTGGGALYMPIYVLAYGSAHKAVPLAKATILGLSVGSFLFNVVRHHPHGNRKPLINFPVAAFLEPPTLLGAFIGVGLNLLLPSFAILLLLVVCLSITTYTTFKKGLELYKTETAFMSSCSPGGPSAEDGEHLTSLIQEKTPLKDITRDDDRNDAIELTSLNVTSNFRSSFVSTQSTLEQGAEGDHHRLTVITCTYLIINWTLNWLALSFAGGPAAILCGNSLRQAICWSIFCVHLLCIFGSIIYLRRFHTRRHLRGEVEIPTDEGGDGWMANTKTLALYSCGASLAGICAGALGIGGGLIKGPLMLQLGLNPLSAVTTATFMLLFTSTSTTLSFALSSRLTLIDALKAASVAFCGSLLGIWIIGRMLQKYRLQSIVSFFLATVIFISMCFMIATGIHSELNHSGANDTSLRTICHAFNKRVSIDPTSEYK